MLNNFSLVKKFLFLLLLFCLEWVMELATYYKQDAVLKSTYETSPFIFFFPLKMRYYLSITN